MAKSSIETNAQEKWTEITILPEWEEEFYHIYTAKKHGKWVMLKTLKPEISDNPEMQAMLDKEFDVRYNLAHSHIVMINDLEDIPGLGRCIITDDVYGDSLRKLINTQKVNSDTIAKLTSDLIEAMSYIQTNHLVHHPISADRIIFTENIGNLKLIDVGFDYRHKLEPDDVSQDIYNFGKVLGEALAAMPGKDAHLERVAHRCMDPDPRKRYRDVVDLRLAIDHHSPNRIYFFLAIFMTFMIALAAWVTILK